jgi:phage-related protein
MSDGAIVFDTKMSDGNIKNEYSKLISNLKSQMKSLEKEIRQAQGYSDSLRKSIEKEPNSNGLQTSLKSNEKHLTQLRSQWDSLNDTMSNVPSTKSAVNGAIGSQSDLSNVYINSMSGNGASELTDQINTAKQEYNDLMDEQSKWNAEGINADPEGWKSLQDNIDKTSDKLEGLYNQYGKATGKNMSGAINSLDSTLNSNQGESVNLENKASSLGKLQNFLSGIKQKALGAGQAVKSFFTGGQKTDSMAKQLSKSIFSLGNMFKLLAIRMMMRAAIKGIEQGFTNLINYSNAADRAIGSLKSSASSASNGLAAAVAPLVNVVAPIVSTITSVFLEATNAVGRFFAMLTGQKTFVVAKKQAAGLATAEGDVAKNANEAQGALAGIDEVNDISAQSSASSGSTAGTDYGSMFDTLDTGPLTDFASRVKGIIGDVVDTFKAIGQAWNEAWQFNGNGEAIMQSIYDIGNDILTMFENIAEATKVWAQNLDLVPLVTSIRNVMDSLEPVIKTITDALTWVWENVILPIGKWAAESAIPALLDVVASALDVVNAILVALQPVLQWLWDTIIKPLGEFLGDVIVGALKLISDALEGIAGWITDNQSLLETILGIVLGIGAALAVFYGVQVVLVTLGTIWDALTSAVTLFSGALTFLAANPILLVVAAIGAVIAIIIMLINNWDTVKQVAQDVWDKICEIWGVVADWFNTTIIQPVQKAFDDLCNTISTLFTDAWNAIVNVWNGAIGFFGGVWNGIKGIFSIIGNWFGNIFRSAWEGIKGIWNGVTGFFQGVWSGITGIFGNVAGWFGSVFSNAWQAVKNVFSAGGRIFEGIKDGIFNAFRGIRRISIMGLRPFSWIGTISVPKIPHLATGTVVPPNAGEFAAVLGDNKRETEVVSPLSTMKEALAEALNENGNSNNNGNVSDARVAQLLENLIGVVETKHILVSDVGKAAADYANAEYKRTGETVFEGV